jgi:hypothetical protein
MSAKNNEATIVTGPTGTFIEVYSDDLPNLKTEWDVKIKRAIYVDVCEGGWVADMSILNGPQLGPYRSRQDALDAEVDWIDEMYFDADQPTN